MRYLWSSILVVFMLAVLVQGVAAQGSQDDINKAYQWLKDKVADSWGNTEENAFSVLALQNFDSSLAAQGVQNLLDNSKDGECWPSPSCRIKDTALATIALYEMGTDTSKPKTWLLDQQKLFLEEGNWFLQLHILSGSNNGTCTVE